MSDNLNDVVQQTSNNQADARDLDEAIKADEAARSRVDEHDSEDKGEVPDHQEKDGRAEPEDKPSEPENKKDDDDETAKRISRLAFEARQERNRAKALAEEVARLKGQAPQLPEDERVAREVEQRASQLADTKAFDAKSNDIYDRGVKEFPDFQETLSNFAQTGVKLTRELIEAADDVGDAHKIIRYLGKNIDIAERIVNLPAHRMGVELAKLQAKASPAKPVSKAPPPIKPISGRAQAERSIEDMSIEEFMKREDEKYFAKRRR